MHFRGAWNDRAFIRPQLVEEHLQKRVRKKDASTSYVIGYWAWHLNSGMVENEVKTGS